MGAGEGVNGGARAGHADVVAANAGALADAETPNDETSGPAQELRAPPGGK